MYSDIKCIIKSLNMGKGRQVKRAELQMRTWKLLGIAVMFITLIVIMVMAVYTWWHL